MRRVALAFAVAMFGMAAAVTVEAATSASQNVTFSVPSTVSIASDGNVAAGVLTSANDYGGSFTITSNDPAGFSITTQAASASTSESGCGSPSASFTANKVSVSAQAVGGMTSGTGGTPNAPFAYSTSPQSVYSANPTAQGSAIHMTSVYHLDPANFPINSAGCSYTFATTWTIAAS
jgi:hypothetical protein